MDVVVDVLGIVAAVVLGLLALLHVYWAFGTRLTAAVIPTVDGQPTLRPSRTASLLVAFLLALSALILVGVVADWEPTWLFRIGAGGITVVLLARAVGDGRTIGITKRVRDTDFARNDTRVFVPLCLFLGGTALLLVLSP